MFLIYNISNLCIINVSHKKIPSLLICPVKRVHIPDGRLKILTSHKCSFCISHILKHLCSDMLIQTILLAILLDITILIIDSNAQQMSNTLWAAVLYGGAAVFDGWEVV